MLKESLIKLILKLRSDQGKFLRLEKDLKLSIFSKQIQLCAVLGHQSGSCDRKVEHVRGAVRWGRKISFLTIFTMYEMEADSEENMFV